ncbi:TonB-dependent receptor [Alloacidobacterium dinghuense]|uniref:TonB-dependent receptor n=1 Tax=Alloacidobacterium dinghuense TaxID=2763107 RepID=A0A7G8BDG9_9BACT|nr:TonB-dependent receptor [Alloacidobacterium dinghuense]QNI30589.1 TonB-dependent receptor [Alloacidobacterium dinghuense]
MKRLFLLCIRPVAVVGIFLIGGMLRAQVANNTALVGTVVDPTGAPISGANVTAVNEETKVVYPGATNAEGYYSITFIVPGTYDIAVEQSGFNKLTKTGLVLTINQALRTDFNLTVGSTTASVTVSATMPAIATDDATLGETFDTKAVEDLPLIGHNALEVAATASNVMIGPTSNYSGVPPGEDFIGAGQREIQNSLNLDGVSIMNNLISLAPARPSTDMISEVQMQSGNYTAQYGSYLGLHINLISKSGTNSLHGAVYDYIQNTALNAAPFFNPQGAPTPIQHYNQYGFDLGGPVYIPKIYNGRNKTFFFASYEKINQVQQSNQGPVSTLTSAMEAGDFSFLNGSQQLYDPYTGQPYPSNQIPASELNTPAGQIAKNIEQYIAPPNLPGSTNNLNVNYPANLFIKQSLDRIDENIGEHVRLFVRYHWQNLSIVGGDPFPTDASYGPTDTRNIAIGYTHIITPNLVNDFRVGLNTVTSNNLNYFAENGLTDAGTKLGIPGFDSDSVYNNPGIPSINFDTYHEAGNDASNWYQDDRTIDGYDQVSWTHGKHNIMAGAELRKLTIGRQATNEPRGAFSFTGTAPTDAGYTSTGYGAADFVIGLAQSAMTPVLPVKGSIGEWRDGFFVLDNWQPFRKLTLNYGLRYELPTVPYSLNGYARILNPDQTALIPASNASVAADFTPTPGFKFNAPNHNNWAPRIGFAYRATENTTLRGGFGIYYNANQLNTYTLTTQNYPLSASVNYFSTASALLSLSSPTPGAGSGSPVAGTCTPKCTYVSAVTMGPYLPTQTLYQWNLSWGQDLWKGAGAELQYLGSHAIHLDRDFYDNAPQPSTNRNINIRRPNQLFGSIRRIQNDEYSHYNGFTAILRQRASHGLSGMLSYTWSHDLDITDNSNGATTTMDQYNIGLDYGDSNWDIRNRFVGTVTYDLPNIPHANALVREVLGGWQTNAIVTLQTGEPFNVNLGFDNANVGLPRGNVQRPNVLHPAMAHCSLHDYIRNGGYNNGGTSCIDASAFVIPAVGTYGDSRRNSIHGPGYSNVNFSIFKNFNIWENLKFQFRAEAGNLFNHPSAGNPNSEIEQGFDPTNPVATSNFGTVTTTSTFYAPRTIQLAGKLVF